MAVQGDPEVTVDPVLAEIAELSDLLDTATVHVRQSLYQLIREAHRDGRSAKDIAVAAKRTEPRIYQILSEPTRKDTNGSGTGNPDVRGTQG